MICPTRSRSAFCLPRRTILGLERLLSLVLIALVVVGPAYAEPPLFPITENPLAEPHFESVGVGVIPRHVVATMAQDRAGFLWVATGDGLVRFDGYHFRPQEREGPDPATRNLGWIRALLAGRDGRLWIGTDSDGLAVYDPISERVSACHGESDRNGGEAHSTATSRIARPTIRALAEDRDGGIWAGSDGGGLDRFDSKSGSLSHYRHTNQTGSLPDDRVLALLVDRLDTLWVGTWTGLSRRQAGSDRFEPVSAEKRAKGGTPLAGRIIKALFQASDGRIWVGT